MDTFDSLNLHPTLSQSLVHMKYEKPTPIQAAAVPLALQGRDIMGSAQTGTGKTAAFAIPLVQALLTSPRGSALVLTPTRELGKQVMDIMRQLIGPKGGIKTAFLIGGEPMGPQINQLRQRPRLIVGTPGRINDHLERGNVMLHDTKFLVLDETDRMLDMGFSIQLDQILKFLPPQRQTLMFSATLPKNILKLAQDYLNNPERVSMGSTIDPAENITQEIIRLDEADKYKELVKQLDNREGSIIVFVKTKHNTEKLAMRLRKNEFDAEAIHGDLKQSRRDRVLREFRHKKYRILVATDVASRGLDIPHIEHVINYDLPMQPEDYIHRIGRTARAGAKGEALCLITPADGRKWNAIQHYMNPDQKSEGFGQSKKGKSGKKFGGKDKSFKRGRRFNTLGDKNKSSNMTGERSYKKSDKIDHKKPFKKPESHELTNKKTDGNKPSENKQNRKKFGAKKFGSAPAEGFRSGSRKSNNTKSVANTNTMSHFNRSPSKRTASKKTS